MVEDTFGASLRHSARRARVCEAGGRAGSRSRFARVRCGSRPIRAGAGSPGHGSGFGDVRCAQLDRSAGVVSTFASTLKQPAGFGAASSSSRHRPLGARRRLLAPRHALAFRSRPSRRPARRAGSPGVPGPFDCGSPCRRQSPAHRPASPERIAPTGARGGRPWRRLQPRAEIPRPGAREQGGGGTLRSDRSKASGGRRALDASGHRRLHEKIPTPLTSFPTASASPRSP